MSLQWQLFSHRYYCSRPLSADISCRVYSLLFHPISWWEVRAQFWPQFDTPSPESELCHYGAEFNQANSSYRCNILKRDYLLPQGAQTLSRPNPQKRQEWRGLIWATSFSSSNSVVLQKVSRNTLYKLSSVDGWQQS